MVLTTSRPWRSGFAKVLIQKEFKRYGVDVRAIDHPTYSSFKNDQDPFALLLNGMMELLDQYERLEMALKPSDLLADDTSGYFVIHDTGDGYPPDPTDIVPRTSDMVWLLEILDRFGGELAHGKS